MDLILFFSVAAIFAILGDLYLCWQTKQYDSASEPETLAPAQEAPTEESPDDRKDPDSAPERKQETTKKKKKLSLKAARIIAFAAALPVAWALAVMSHRVYGNSAAYTLKLLCTLELLIPIGILDAKYMKIPNKVLLAGLVIFVGFFLYEWLALREGILPLLKEALFGLLLGGGVFLVVGLISRNGLGGGDIKLFSVLGILLTWRGVFNILFFSMLIIAVYAVILLVSKKAKKDTKLPMGPFVTLAMMIAILLGL